MRHLSLRHQLCHASVLPREFPQYSVTSFFHFILSRRTLFCFLSPQRSPLLALPSPNLNSVTNPSPGQPLLSGLSPFHRLESHHDLFYRLKSDSRHFHCLNLPLLRLKAFPPINLPFPPIISLIHRLNLFCIKTLEYPPIKSPNLGLAFVFSLPLHLRLPNRAFHCFLDYQLELCQT